VERFQEAAEKYGYLVAGSNNSRNGPFEPSLAAMDAMWRDTHSRFRIDARRRYAAGFSGGVRVACRFAQAGNLVAGVIACGGGFPGGMTPKPVPFVFFGTAGTEDFNYPELRQLDRELDSLAVPHRVVTFDGGHDWASRALATQAIEWMEIQAMKAGRRPVDQALAEALFASNLARIQGLESSGRLAEAFFGYVALAAEFRGLKEDSEFERKGAQRERSKAVKKSFKEEKEQESLHQQVGGELFGLSRELENPEQRQASLASLRRAVGGLRKKAEGKEDSGSRRVARWVLEGLFVQAYEESRDLRERKNYPLAAAKLEVRVAIHPERPLIHYYLAGAYASSGNKKKALAALQKAVETGFRDAAGMNRGPSLEGLRREAAFEQILEEISRPQ